MRGAAEEQLAERQRLTVTSTDQRPLAMRSVHFPFDCDAFLEMIPKLNQEIYIVWYLYIIGRFCLSVTKNEHFAQRSQINFYFYFQVGFHVFHGSRLVFMVPGWLRTPKSVFWLDDPVSALSAIGRLWPSSGNLKKITLMKTLWFAVRYFNRQE